MKCYITTVLIVLFSTFLSCNTFQSGHREKKSLIAEKCLMAELMNYYYYSNCDYPYSVDDLVSFFHESDLFEAKDSMKVALLFLDENKNDIVCQHTRPTFTTMNTLVTFKDDTLFCYNGNYGFPGLDLLIHEYFSYHFHSPTSFHDLLEFGSLKYAGEYNGLYHCLDGTLAYISDNQDKIEWISDNNSLLITTSFGDTIAYQSGCNIDYLCSTNIAAERFLFRFYDRNNSYAYTPLIEHDFKDGIHQLSQDYPNIITDESNVHLLVFSLDKYLRCMCPNDSTSLNTDWFQAVEQYCASFCRENDIYEIVFGIQPRCKD